MPEEISVDRENKVVVVRSWGHVSKQDVGSSTDRVCEICGETGINKVLIDAREQHSYLKTVETYEHGKYVEENAISRRIKWAIVPSGRTLGALRFLETTALNRGLNFKVVDSMEQAMTWFEGYVAAPESP